MHHIRPPYPSNFRLGQNSGYPRPPTLRDLHKTVKEGIGNQQEQQQQKNQQRKETIQQVRAMEKETVNEDNPIDMAKFKMDILNLRLTSPNNRNERIDQMKLIMKIFNYYKKHCRGNKDFTFKDEILYKYCPSLKNILPSVKYSSFRYDWKNFYLDPKLRELYIDQAPYLKHFHYRNWRNNDYLDENKRRRDYLSFTEEKYKKEKDKKAKSKAEVRRTEYNKLVNGKTTSIQNRKVRKGQQDSRKDGGMDTNDM